MPITVHENDTIMGSVFVVEEHIFINCKLKNCRLYYSGGAFEWQNTSFENCASLVRQLADLCALPNSEVGPVRIIDAVRLWKGYKRLLGRHAWFGSIPRGAWPLVTWFGEFSY